MSGSIGGGWRSQLHGETEHAPNGLSLSNLKSHAEPAAYLTWGRLLTGALDLVAAWLS